MLVRALRRDKRAKGEDDFVISPTRHANAGAGVDKMAVPTGITTAMPAGARYSGVPPGV